MGPIHPIRKGESHFDLQIPVSNLKFMATDFDSWIVRPGSIFKTESPRMPGAGHNSVLNMS